MNETNIVVTRPWEDRTFYFSTCRKISEIIAAKITVSLIISLPQQMRIYGTYLITKTRELFNKDIYARRMCHRDKRASTIIL
jgi:hypothetical protein